jgi:hypothetical protein
MKRIYPSFMYFWRNFPAISLLLCTYMVIDKVNKAQCVPKYKQISNLLILNDLLYRRVKSDWLKIDQERKQAGECLSKLYVEGPRPSLFC